MSAEQNKTDAIIEDIVAGASSPSASRRRGALDAWANSDRKTMIGAALRLIASPHRDVRDAVVAFCCEEYPDDEEISRILCDYAAEHASDLCPEAAESLLTWLSASARRLTPAVMEWVHRSFYDGNPEIRYRAFCLAEYAEDSSEAYWSHVRASLESDDEDFRIVAAQALARRRARTGDAPEAWVLPALEARLPKAGDTEGFHLRLALLRLSDDAGRAAAVKRLIGDIEDARFSYPAIEAVMECGTGDIYGTDDAKIIKREAAEALLRVSRSLFGEPTVRVLAAATAAKLGSASGLALLRKFAAGRRGNPAYARQLLAMFDPPAGGACGDYLQDAPKNAI